MVDPSHAAGRRDLVIPLALAAYAVGPHGLIVEIHPEPEKALSDGPAGPAVQRFRGTHGADLPYDPRGAAQTSTLVDQVRRALTLH